MKEISPERNPLLTAVYKLHNSKEVDEFIQDYMVSLENGGPNKDTFAFYKKYSKIPPRERKEIVIRNIGQCLFTYKIHMGDTPETEQVLSLWEEALRKL